MLGIDLSKIGDATVRQAFEDLAAAEAKALDAIASDIQAIQTGPFAQLAQSVQKVVDQFGGGEIEITIPTITIKLKGPARAAPPAPFGGR